MICLIKHFIIILITTICFLNCCKKSLMVKRLVFAGLIRIRKTFYFSHNVLMSWYHPRYPRPKWPLNKSALSLCDPLTSFVLCTLTLRLMVVCRSNPNKQLVDRPAYENAHSPKVCFTYWAVDSPIYLTLVRLPAAIHTFWTSSGQSLCQPSHNNDAVDLCIQTVQTIATAFSRVCHSHQLSKYSVLKCSRSPAARSAFK